MEILLKWRLILKRNWRDNQKSNILAGSMKIAWRRDIRGSECLFKSYKKILLEKLQCYSVWQCSPLNACKSYWQCFKASFTKSELRLSPLYVSGFSSYKTLQWHKMFLECMAFQNIINTQGWDLGCQWTDMLQIIQFREADLYWERYLYMYYCTWESSGFLFYLDEELLNNFTLICSAKISSISRLYRIHRL